jgi:two-component system chemotaxis response regulator CheY
MRKTILLVDDSRTIRQQMKEMLLAAEFDVLEAADCVEALERLSRDGGVDLVLCDLQLPNTLELLTRLKRRHRLPELPFLVVSTQGAAEQVERVRSLGARGWMVKPFKPERLVATVQQLVS